MTTGSRRDIPAWLALCTPVSLLFTLLILHARGRPLPPADTLLTVALWFLWGGIGFLWSARPKAPVPLVTIAALGLSVWFAAWRLPAATTHRLDRVENRPAPGFTLQTLDGVDIPAGEWRGRVVVFDFFSESCGPCRAELPHMEDVRRRLEGRDDILLVLVASDLGGDSPESIRAFMQANHIGIRAAFDRGGKAHAAFGFVGVPALIVLDRSGSIRLGREGYNRAEGGLFASKLAALLSSL